MKINIKGPIIPNSDQWIYDWFGVEAVSPKKISDQLKEANNEDLVVEINSGGGSVFDASEIYTTLKDYQGKVTVKIVGIAASAASVIAMAGDKVMMSPTAQMMIHNASVRAEGDYRDMDHASAFLKNVNQTIANAYSLKSGKPYEELLSMMDAETWLTPQQALEHNLIDEIMFDNQIVQAVASADSGMIPKQVIEKIRNELSANKTEPINSLPKANVMNASHEKEEEDNMDIEKLKNEYPELYEQIKNEGYEEGVKAENQRIQAIEELELPGNEELVNKAKFETKITAQELAVEIIKAEKQRGKNYLENRLEDAQTLNKVPGDVAPQASGKDEKVEAAEKGKSIADIINRMRGAVK